MSNVRYPCCLDVTDCTKLGLSELNNLSLMTSPAEIVTKGSYFHILIESEALV